MKTLYGVQSTLQYTLADGGSVPYRLSSLDLADCCGFRSYFKVTFFEEKQLLFCYHHFRVHEEAIRRQATHIVDESAPLFVNRLRGSEN